MDTGYTIHKSSTGVIDADAAAGQPSEINRIGRGDSVSITFRDIQTRLVVEGGETFTVTAGDTEQFDVVEVRDGGTLDVNGTLETDVLINDGSVTGSGSVDVNDRYAFELEDLREYREYAGKATVTGTLNGTQKFSERVGGSDLDTLVIGIEPSDDLHDEAIPGVWGVVNDVQDARNPTLADSGATITLSVLAPFKEYSSVSDVTNNLKLD